MIKEFKIPFLFKTGKFHYSDLGENVENVLTLFHGQFDILSYFTPNSNTEVRLYDISERSLTNDMYVTYDHAGKLKYVELVHDDEVRLLFINYLDDNNARSEILDFAEQSADIISDELLQCQDLAARLFIEYYKEYEGFDFAAKIGTVKDKQAVIDSLTESAKQRGLEKMVVDNSGDYPNENRIECDRYTIEIMLLCSPLEIRDGLLDMVISVMTDKIKNKVIDRLNKSDDFKCIVSEYD